MNLYGAYKRRPKDASKGCKYGRISEDYYENQQYAYHLILPKNTHDEGLTKASLLLKVRNTKAI